MNKFEDIYAHACHRKGGERELTALLPEVRTPRALQRAGLDIKDNVTSKREMALIQGQFNQWHGESGLAYSHLSRICAYSV